MQNTLSHHVLKCIAALAVLVTATHAQTTWYVSPSGSDANNGTSAATAFEHLSYAISDTAVSGDTVLVAPGVYDVATNGDNFPVSVPSGVTVTGTGSLSNPCKIGGDANVGPGHDISALFVIGGSGLSVSDVTIEGLTFLGEDSAGRDSPSGVLIDGDVELTNIVIEGCVFTRGEMNDATTNDRASILVTGEDLVNGVTIESNRITVNEHGGIEFLGNAGVGLEVYCVNVLVLDNVIGVPFGEDSKFGFRWNGVDRGLGGRAWIANNVFTGKWSSTSTHGMDYGIDISMNGDESPGGGTGAATFNIGQIFENTITGCVVDGIRLSADGTTANPTPNITIDELRANFIGGCGEAGIHLRYDDDGANAGAGYLNIQTEGNVLVENTDGVKLTGFGSGSAGNNRFVNNTIADNASSGVAFLAPTLPLLSQAEHDDLYPVFLNNIFYYNNALSGGGYGDQVDVSHAAIATWFEDLTSHCDWQGGPLVNDNIDAAPLFINAGADNYRLSSSPTLSPCIDEGFFDIFNVFAKKDINGDRRILDGDFDCTGTPENIIDIGADEVPKPSCGP